MRTPQAPPQGEADHQIHEHVLVHPDGTKEIVNSRQKLNPKRASKWKRLVTGGTRRR